MRNVYSVKQVNAYIKNMFNQDFMLNRIVNTIHQVIFILH